MAAFPRMIRVLALCAGFVPGFAIAQQAQGPTPVTVVTLAPQDVTLTSLLPGRVAASAEAEVRPQVNGIITERLFEEGADVTIGDPLYQIDKATYEATVRQSRAGVAQAAAQLRAAEREARRLVELQSRNVASEQALDEATSTRDAAAAGLELAEAQLNSAEIELSRTTIRARLSGRIGLSLTSQGALVTASQAQPLTVIRNINPVYVDVTQSAADLLRWRRGETERELEDADATVRLKLADGSDYSETGQLKAAEPNVNPQTGVVTLRMQFDNPDLLLLPGMYVQVDMPVEVARDVYLVPQEGVVRDRRGRPLAWVVNGDGVIEERALNIIQDRGNAWVVDEGLNPGDRVMVAGFQKTAPGATVTPEERAAAQQQ
ncbi:Toluene efflux pump periplasmic linker protein TtgA [Roseovarius sp. EC-HK134]|uniref:Toluene efflux pump periplasmic linker protein TtgA n=2 Tax=Roseobacteraceae TaxID=2854170 RepID=A0A1V0RQP3_9RHOB|nr:toluene efflux pump periplasmic linker protein TtgA [Roseovarius mucosus]VVT03726.1 Toluene efflux pump periplasmic linker protein TtgA [Roseovarius sp. EC-HK134]VVT04123.1 Toluene efflux pump periplasmic linker protein TtgA [Roseovarius sp. EC-SD190]